MDEAKPSPGLLLAKEELTCSISQGMAVVLAGEAFQQLYAYAKVMEMESEISCLGSVTRKGDVFRIERFYLLKQKGSFGSTEMDPQAVAELIERLKKEGKQEEARSIKCWCHTHGTMGAFWSDTDKKTCRLLASDYLISIVVGGGFQVRCRLDTQTPVPMTIDGIAVYYEPPVEKEALDRYAEELRRHVTSETWLSHAPPEMSEEVGTLEWWMRERNRKKESGENSLPGGEKGGSDVEIFCEYCGDWHSAEVCPLLEYESAFYDDSEYGRF